jgi:hypothetical protein
MRGADDPALAILMARATASDKIIDRINRRRRRAQVEPRSALTMRFAFDQFIMKSHQDVQSTINFGETMRTSYAQA